MTVRSGKYPPELRERAVRMVAEIRGDHESEWAAMGAVASMLGVRTPETVRKWVRRAQIDAGARPGVTSEESDQIKRLKRENFELRRANEILKAASTFFAAELDRPQRFSRVFIESYTQAFGVVPICSVLSEHGCPIAPSTYYEARHRSLSIRAARDEDLKVKISVAHRNNFSVYGARTVWLDLNRQGTPVAWCTVERLMRTLCLQGARRGKRFRTTVPDQGAARPADLVNRNFNPLAPNRTWVADFTYCPTWSGMVYVAFVIDAYSRRILGWRTATHMKTVLVLDALEQAIWTRARDGVSDLAGLVHHNDAGSQYTSIAFTDRLIAAGVDPSVGSVG